MFHQQRLRLVTGLAAFALILTACHGGSSGTSTFVPANSTSVTAPQSDAGAMPDHNRGSEIRSSCGRHVHILLAGFVACHFREPGYGDGTFTLTDQTHGLVGISPTSGNRHTRFTITGLVVGSGRFTVRDDHHNHIVVHVHVTL